MPLALNIKYLSSDDGGGGLTTSPTADIEAKTANYQFLTVRMAVAFSTHYSLFVPPIFPYSLLSPCSLQYSLSFVSYKPREKRILAREFLSPREADIEIRTNTQSTVVQYTNQPGADDPEATRVVETATPWTEWQEHRYELDARLEQMVRRRGPGPRPIDFQAPTSVLLNVWSDGGVWSGEMEVGARGGDAGSL
ncbi:hypothetical protein F5B17DRAFT_454268 [Nemania serpens]|nr:hypothetical protein F5B17DRAFT_454268 [Nemania serpens]